MPYIGLIPFLLMTNWQKNLKAEGVNALHRAYPISTLRRGFLRSHLYVVSMPYIGLIPFLLSDVYNESHQYKVVSMPYIGLIPFLQYPLKNLIKSMVSGTVFRG